ncbi:MAG: fimbrillin family protein [Clostridium sp.]|nr:fimbrillin family protein [Clostridium sp.]
MKKYTYMALAASVAMLSACSNDDDLAAGTIGGNVDVEGNPVEIVLGNGGMTRAAIQGDGDLDEMGIFCLAKAKQEINSGASDINWFDNDPLHWSACIMNNVAATKQGASITWLEEGKHYFYPISQFYSYDFYGYYPYDAQVDTTMLNTVVANYVIDGSQDIIWGKATSEEQYAYSAKYFRLHPEVAKPKLDLQHLLSRFTFTAIPDEEGADEGAAAAGMTVQKIYIKQVYTNLALTVAKRDANGILTEEEGVINPNSDIREDVYLKNEDGTELTPASLANGEVNVGESLLLYPEAKYLLAVDFTHESFPGEVMQMECWLEMNGKDGAVFEKGKSYNVKLTVHGPKEITLEAELQDWEEGDGIDIEL